MARPIRQLLALLAVLAPAAGHAVTLPADLERLCRTQTLVQPAAEAPYRPGVDAYGRAVAGADDRAGRDAYGRAVAPADLGAGVRISPPAEVRIDLTRRLDTLVPGLDKTGIAASDVKVGTVTVETATGASHYNGQPLADGRAAGVPLGATMREICRRRFGRSLTDP